jgi:hypothetical protein
MTGVIRKATFLVALGLVAAVMVATAGVPSPGNCTFPTYIDLSSCDGSGNVNPAANFPFQVTIRDIGNFPVVNQLVAVGFAAKADVKCYGAFPGWVSNQCAEAIAVTDVNGVANFRSIPGAGYNTTGNYLVGATTYTGENAATFYAGNCGGAVLGTAHVCVFDENGVALPVAAGNPTITATDLSAWGADYKLEKGPTPPGRPLMYRSNFNHSAPLLVSGHYELLSSADLSLWGAVKKTVYINACTW